MQPRRHIQGCRDHEGSSVGWSIIGRGGENSSWAKPVQVSFTFQIAFQHRTGPAVGADLRRSRAAGNSSCCASGASYVWHL